MKERNSKQKSKNEKEQENELENEKDNEKSMAVKGAGRKKLEPSQVLALLEKYRLAKAELDSRIRSNERWWRLRHWGEFGRNVGGGIGAGPDGENCKPVSAWLFNSIANKHADAMDNYPEATVLPRTERDKEAASMLCSVIPVCLERCNYEQVYSDVWWYKLKNGTSCQGVFWNPSKEHGMGGIEIKPIDLLRLYWEPGVTDIQDSPAVFYLQTASRESLKSAYRDKEIPLSDGEISSDYSTEQTDTDGKVTVIDMYYKVSSGNDVRLHLMKLCGNTVLYDSAEDPVFCESGIYEHGLYPFVFDTMYSVSGSICGLGCIDIMKDAQMYIDRLGQVILDHTAGLARKRFFVRHNSAVSEAEFRNTANPFVHVAGSLTNDDIREIGVSPLDSSVITALTLKIDELKETSGNRDFSQGSTSGGVTAASAIAALQEAGSKLSRDMIKSSYRAFSAICEMMISILRQFGDTPREYYRLGSFSTFDGRILRGSGNDELFGIKTVKTVPDFDVSVKAAKRSPFSKAAQNELVRELYSMGFFRPENADAAIIALNAMDFEGKAEVIKAVRAGAEKNAPPDRQNAQ